jgi:tRNA(Ile)-lysidine synthase
MFAHGDRVAVAVSGGADSVCLLTVLVDLAPRSDLKLSVVHVNHNLRGEASRADAEFVRALAERHGLECMMKSIALAAGGNLEERARAARLAIFRELVESGAASRIAVGHTRSDQAETVLYRFLRGAGATGLAAIHPVTREGLVRPLIGVERRAIVEFLESRGIGWREDASNASLNFARNRIRHGLLPSLLREWNPALVETLAHTADLSFEEELYWRDEIDRLAARHLRQGWGGVLLRTGDLTGLPLAAARRLVRHAVDVARGGGYPVDFRHVEEIMELAVQPKGNGRVQVAGVEVCRSFEWLRVGKPREAIPFHLTPPVPGVMRIPGSNTAISLEMRENPKSYGSQDRVYNSEMGCLDWERLRGPLEVRSWQPGDQYHPAGSTAARKIKTLFQQARIPVWERGQWPVLTCAGSIVWTRRFGAANAVAAGDGSTKVLAVGEVEVR